MEIVSVDKDNIHLLKYFIDNIGVAAESFRYYNSRSVDIINNHLTTLLFIEKSRPVAYGHLDLENEIVWLGICVLPEHHGNGFGKMMMKELIFSAKKLNVTKIFLTVDRDNKNAISLYKKFNFQKQDKDSSPYLYSLGFADQ